jgi:periplasmic divalent cation tolerance protein
MKHSIIYITCRDSAEAERIGKALVEKRLAACVNIIPETTSLYRWEGKIQEERESLLLVKTRTSLTGKITKIVKSLHSYSTPCIISLPITKGDKDYLEWIEKETETP